MFGTDTTSFSKHFPPTDDGPHGCKPQRVECWLYTGLIQLSVVSILLSTKSQPALGSSVFLRSTHITLESTPVWSTARGFTVIGLTQLPPHGLWEPGICVAVSGSHVRWDTPQGRLLSRIPTYRSYQRVQKPGTDTGTDVANGQDEACGDTFSLWVVRQGQVCFGHADRQIPKALGGKGDGEDK